VNLHDTKTGQSGGDAPHAAMTGLIHDRCRHYRGSKPCVFNKTEGAECPTCRHLDPVRARVLFIKLDAIGDVLRSASMIPLLRARRPGAYIAWLTRRDSVEMVGLVKDVDEVIELSPTGLARVQTGAWDEVVSLSNDLDSASLATLAAGDAPVTGYRIEQGVVRATNPAAQHWLELASFDRLKRANAQSYQRLMADIIGHAGPVPPPALVVPRALRDAAAARVAALFGRPRGRRRVAINLGSGARWPKKMIDATQIAQCCAVLRRDLDAEVMLVGGAAEAQKLLEVQALCGEDAAIVPVLTSASIPDFVAVLMQADALLCGDTLALHVATAIGLPTVAVFGPTSQAEIADFDGLVAKTWTDRLDCLCCYGDCTKTAHCMALLDPVRLAGMVAAQIGRAPGG
jgi:ADP-heptose:LPS heptosyltransferase